MGEKCGLCTGQVRCCVRVENDLSKVINWIITADGSLREWRIRLLHKTRVQNIQNGYKSEIEWFTFTPITKIKHRFLDDFFASECESYEKKKKKSISFALSIVILTFHWCVWHTELINYIVGISWHFQASLMFASLVEAIWILFFVLPSHFHYEIMINDNIFKMTK